MSDDKPRWWIGERCGRFVTTVLVRAASRKEADEKLKNPGLWPTDDILGCDTSYEYRSERILREDKPGAHKKLV